MYLNLMIFNLQKYKFSSIVICYGSEKQVVRLTGFNYSLVRELA